MSSSPSSRPKMTEEFLNEIMKNVVGVLCQNIGWHAAQTTSIDILADLMKRQFLQLAKSSHNYAEHYGRTQANLDDAALALRDMGINASELEEYVQNFDPVQLPYAKDVPQFPIPRESKLNFLRPGSEEVLTRAVHVHEYMPPMIFEEETKTKEDKESGSGEGKAEDEAKVNGDAKDHMMEVIEAPRETTPEKDSGKSDVKTNDHVDDGEDSSEDEIEALESKSPGSKGFVPFSSLSTKLSKSKKGYSGENPALKRVRMMLEEEGPPLREITSVMMTTSGFLTSSREGRLPDTRPPSNREFFDPSPPSQLEKKKKVLTMKRIVEGVKKIDKEKDPDKERDEPTLFGNPDRIPSLALAAAAAERDEKPKPSKSKDKESRDIRKSKKLKKLKLDKETMKKLSKGMEQRDKNKLKIFKKSKSKLMLDKSLKKNKRIKDKLSRKHQHQHHVVKEPEDLGNAESDEDEDFGADAETPFQELQIPPVKIPKRKDQHQNQICDQILKIKKLKQKPHVPHPPLPKISPKLSQSMAHTMSISPDGEMLNLKKKRGRPRKNPVIPLPHGRRVPLPPAALAGLGRALMDEKHRPLKIKKSHMEPDMRSLIPDISINTKPSKPPRMQQPPPQQSNYDMLMGLPSTPGLIPTGFVLPPPPPLIKMPTPAAANTPSIHITPATPTTPGASMGRPGKAGKNENPNPFSSLPGNVCSSVTITPIDMPGQKLPTRYDKTVTPGIGSPVLTSTTRQPKAAKEKSPIIAPAVLPMSMKTETSSGLSITPIVMDKADRFENIQSGDKLKAEKPQPQSMLAKLEEDMKSKEQRKREKELKKLKKEKKKEKKDKDKDRERDKDKKERKEKDKEKKKKKDKSLALAEQMSPNSSLGIPTVPKLTLKFGGHSGTSTPVDSPNPPQVYLGEASPPLPKKITFKPIEEMRKQKSPSPEVARFSALVTRPSKPQRAAKTHAAAAVAAEAMGSSIAQQMVSFPSTQAGREGAGASNSKRGRGRPTRGGSISERPEKPEKEPKSAKSKAAQGLITETVGCIMDEHGNKIWICPQCGRQDDGSPMIGCDKCDDWYHFTCMGITDTPAEDTQWFCPRCRKKTKKDKKS